MQTPAQYRKSLSARAYEKRHNYMAVPGEKMPEYSEEELNAIEEYKEAQTTEERREKRILLKHLAKKYGRSFVGFMNKIHRLYGNYVSPTQRKRNKYRHDLELKAAGLWDWNHNCPTAHTQFIPNHL